MSSRWRSWIVPVIFWALFVASIGLGKRYRWLDTAWCVAGMLFLLGISVYSVIYTVRHRHETGSISYKGIPRWLERFSLDENDDVAAASRRGGSRIEGRGKPV